MPTKIGLVEIPTFGLEDLDDDSAGRVVINQGCPGPTAVRVEQLPFDDQATFELLSSGKTTGGSSLKAQVRDLLKGLGQTGSKTSSPSSRSIVRVPWISFRLHQTQAGKVPIAHENALNSSRS